MAIKLFGFQLGRTEESSKVTSEPDNKTFALPNNDDGAVTIQTGAYYGTYVDLDGTVRNEIELITRYREMAMQPELENAVDEIVNEAIVADDTGNAVEINMDDLKEPKAIKNKIQEEFQFILKLLNFGNMGNDVFRRWYVDGRLFYHIIVDENDPKKGIKEIRYIDPRRIRKIREIQKMKDVQTGMEIIRQQNEYYLYNERGVIGTHSNLGTKIAPDSIVNVNSGLMDAKRSMVLSYLHKAIKPLNQLRMVEDATVIYRLSRAPERRVFYIDVGNMPTVKANQYVQDIMKQYRNKLVYDSCLAMDTKVPLLDGRTLTITEINREFEEGKKLWVYSCDPVTGKFAPGLITSAGVTRFNEQVMRLTLDNGKTITCTLDHKFPVWNKGKVEAKDLIVGDSMLPLYTREKVIHPAKTTYQQVLQNDSNKWEFTHRLVSQWKDSVGLENEWFFKEDVQTKKTVHHKDYIRYNNDPFNLVRMNNKDHLNYHKQHNSLAGKIGGAVTVARKRENNTPFFLNVDPIKRQIASIESGKNLGNKLLGFHKWSPEKKRKHSKLANKALGEKLKTDPVFAEKYSNAISAGWKDGQRVKAAERGKNRVVNMHKLDNCRVCGFETTIGNITRWHNDKCKALHNHKITKIEFLDERIDVGTLGIDKNEIYHNYHTFALDAGIYTCNSTGEIKDDRRHLAMLEDFWLPRREGNRSSEITTLKGGENLGKMDDVEYFEKKLYKALGIPSSRIESQGGGGFLPGNMTTAITRDELKFSKFIMRLRNKFSTLFDDLLRIQLSLKQVCNVDEWKKFKEYIWYDYKKDVNIAEIKEQELLTMRINLLSLVQPYVGIYYSQEWVRKKILSQTDEDIKDIDKQIMKEGPPPMLGPNGQMIPADQALAMQQQQDPTGQAQGEQQYAGPDGSPMNPDGTPVEPPPSKYETTPDEMEFTKK